LHNITYLYIDVKKNNLKLVCTLVCTHLNYDYGL